MAKPTIAKASARSLARLSLTPNHSRSGPDRRASTRTAAARPTKALTAADHHDLGPKRASAPARRTIVTTTAPAIRARERQGKGFLPDVGCASGFGRKGAPSAQ